MTTEQAYEARLDRVKKTIALEEADRVPFIPKTGALMASMYGLSHYDMMKDARNIIPCAQKYLTEFQPDVVWPVASYPIDPCELLGAQYIRLPGPSHGLPMSSSFQMLDGTYMEDEEFDEFLMDPTHFMLTKVMPRKYKALNAFSKLHAREIYDLSVLMDSAVLAQGDVSAAIETMIQAGKLCAKHIGYVKQLNQCIVEMGFPLRGGALLAPFDSYADSLRGLVQAVMDIKMYPGEALAVIERIERMNIDRAIAAAKAQGALFQFIPLHAAGDEFMSREDYATFYWPSLKRTIEKLVAAGITPYVFCEGKYSTRLEFLKDVPKGKVVYMFEQIDIAKAKRELEGIACVCGNLPTTLLISGTRQQVIDETKRMLDACAPGGGFIMDCSITMDDCKKENFAAWQETTMTYGKY